MGKTTIKQFKFGEWTITVDNISGDARLIITRKKDNSEIIFRKSYPIAHLSNSATMKTKQLRFCSLQELEAGSLYEREIYYEL